MKRKIFFFRGFFRLHERMSCKLFAIFVLQFQFRLISVGFGISSNVVNHDSGETYGPCHRHANRDRVPNVSPVRLTLYCDRIYEIRGDGIPPFTYARTFWALLLAASPIQYVNLLDLSGCPYPLALAAVTRICVTLLLQIADLGKMSHFVSFRQRTCLQHCTYTRQHRFQCFSNRKTYNRIGVFVLKSRYMPKILYIERNTIYIYTYKYIPK